MLEGLELKLALEFDIHAVSEPHAQRFARQTWLPDRWGPPLLSAMGGAVGILFGIGACALVRVIGPVVPAVVSLQSVFLAVCFSVSVGLFFGTYPATRAAALNPIDALRYE